MPSERKLNDWIGGFMQYTENTEPPKLFRKWTAISCIASAMQRKIRINWGTALVFYPNFYIVLVGPSATGKGTAMNPGLNILDEIPAIRLSAQATSLQALIRRLKDTNLTDIDMVTGEQIYHSSLTVFSKEFTVFLGYQNRELMAALCDWYDCDRKWVYETISRKTEQIDGVWFNLIAGTTPDLIRSSLPIESVGGGLTSRIIFIYEEAPDKLVTLPTETNAERELFECLVHDLEKISLMSGSFKWTAGFAEGWDSWCRANFNNPPFRDSKFDGYNGRRRVHLIKLAMVVAMSHGQNGLILTSGDLKEAAELLAEAEVKMALTFKGVGKSDIAELVHKASSFIMRSKTAQIPLFQFARYFENDMDKFVMDRVLSTLEMSKGIKVVTKPGADSYIQRLGDEEDN
jgi:hypothetical protein